MIAKFHSAPGHSMETTLTISLPPPQSVRAARGEPPREKQKEKEKERKRERDDDKDREPDKERDRTREREKDAKEHDRERAGKTVSYKDKFQRMRERYDRVTATQETHQRDLDILNAKIKKLQAENDLLLDAMYTADSQLYERYFPGHLVTPSAIPPNSFPLPNQHLAQPRFPEQYPPPVSHHSIPQYPPTMPPPGSMPPPPHSSSSTSIPPGLIPPSLPPHPLLPQSAMAMPPPSLSASNGAIGNAVVGTGSPSRRHSNASSRSRRRSDARGSMSSLIGTPLAPEDASASTNEPSSGGTSRRAVTPTTNAGLNSTDDLPLRSPRVNGGLAAPLRRTPSMQSNGVAPSLAGHRQTEIPYATPVREGEIINPEAFPDEPPAVHDNPAYNMNAYAAVNSPDEPDEDMHVDV